MLPKPLTMFKFLVRFALFSVLFLYFLTLGTPTNAGCGNYFTCQKEIQRVRGEISRLEGLADTLENQIAYLDNQIYLSELEIQSKESEIKVLSGDIGDLSTRLERIGNFLDYQEEIFANRARLAYASDQLSSFDIVLGAENLDDALRRIKYLHVLEDQDIQALNEMRDTRTSFNDQKKVLEDKKSSVEKLKKEVESEKASLIAQQNSKEYLLKDTRGQEASYQQLLKQLKAELNSILAALRSGGTVIGEVKVSGGQFKRLTNQGNTGCTTGPHIHYAVGVGPVGNSRIDYFLSPWGYPAKFRLSGSTVMSGNYASPGGPVNYLTQGYWSGHKALDVVSRSGWNGSYYGVYASASGTAYLVKDTTWGSWCWTGKKYDGPAYGIVVDHHNGYKTLYWHIQP
jgi:peptidoglycan hydrolase CwlO-like protein